MAKCKIEMPEEFLIKISKLSEDMDIIAEKVLKEGGEIVLKKVKNNLNLVIGKETKYKSRSTGELISSLGLTPVKIDNEGNYNIKIGFSENRNDGEINAKIANVIEYGKHGQEAKPFLKTAKNASKTECISVMQRKFEEEVSKL